MERAVAEQASQLQATFDALADPIYVFDAHGRILRQNRAEMDAFGFDTSPVTIEERAARIDLRDDEGRRIASERLPARRVLTGETLVGIDTILLVARGADGGDHWYMVGGAPIRDEAGRVTGGLIIFRDVTERRRLGQQTRWQASMLERAHDAIFMWELDGPILYWNRGAELLYGYSSEEAVGQVSHRLLHTEHHVSPAAFKKALKRDGEWIGDILHTTRDGRRIVVESRHQLLTEPDGRRYVLEACRDITERLRLEQELRASRDELERRVVERTQDLAKANTELRRLSHRILEVQESERRLIARELHDEIGQALTGVKMMLELLETHEDQTSANNTTVAQRTAARLPKLSDVRASIGETLQHVRDLSLDLRPAILDSMGLLPALLWQFERYTRQTSIVVKFHQTGLNHRLPLEVETAAYRIIQEALTNVARHAGVSQVVVQIRVSEETLALFVVDEGAGFDAEQAVEATFTMGLAGMRERADLSGGTLRISSAPGEGATIEAELPLMTSSDAVDLLPVGSMRAERESGA
jgi:PAS domain S-box-containing protein